METMEITQRTGNYYGDNTHNHIWEITDANGTAAELYVSTDRHEIMNITVRPDRRNEGLARALYETASAAMDIYRAPEAHRTPEGHAFAEAVGGDTVEPYPCDCYTCDHADDEEDEDY
jgi:GNAT superfamily N-acetyltransferase